MTGATALLLAGAMGAFACTNLATLNLDTNYAAAGETIDVTGSSFSEVGDGTQPVEVRWNATDGPLLGEAEPDSSGAFATEVTVPEDAEAGRYVLIATQAAAEPGHGLEAGEEQLAPVFGTPARASLVLGDPSAPQAIDPGGQPTGAPSGDSTIGLTALSGLLAVLGAGVTLLAAVVVMRRSRGRAEQPAT